MAYQTLLTKNGDWRPSLGNLQFRVLEKDRPRSLEKPFFGRKEELKDFRLINLVGGLYKLFAKVLANRLKSAMRKLVSDSQQAIIQGRHILDAALISNEAMDSRLKVNIPGLLLKLDIEKVFDHVNWDYLLSIMTKMGFGERWISWIS
uniref:Reverse transcriptase domain-containing protein n=1 Tax=Vitis vinifera TaxID=29760 RepID=A5BWH2_VITVI|nr:hypothetical protein VITISV_018352 [Vitis vinifera]